MHQCNDVDGKDPFHSYMWVGTVVLPRVYHMYEFCIIIVSARLPLSKA